MAKRKSSSSAGARTLTPKDQEKFQRLLKTAKTDNVRLAIDLTEATCSQAELNDLYTDEIILSLVSSGDMELFAVTASFFLRHKEQWERFLRCAADTRVLTRTVMLNRTANLSDFTAITVEAATLLVTNASYSIELSGLSTISLEVVQQLVKSTCGLELNGLTALADDIAVVLATHEGDRLKLNGLTSLSDTAAESLSNHKGGDGEYDGLELDGLTSLSDAAAESFGKHKSGLSLDGISHLSEVAAKHLAQHEDKLSLYGLTDLSGEAALAFANKEILQTNGTIGAQIAEATKNLTTTSASLTPAQRRKIKKLITVEHLSTACELLKSADAKEGDWLAVFSKTKIKNLVDTWDVKTWNTLVDEMKPFPKVYELLKATIKQRINYRGSDPSVYWRYRDNLKPILRKSSRDLKSLINKAEPYTAMERPWDAARAYYKAMEQY